jgi:hypothetical protein
VINPKKARFIDEKISGKMKQIKKNPPKMKQIENEVSQ